MSPRAEIPEHQDGREWPWEAAGGYYAHVFESDDGSLFPFEPRPEVPLPKPIGNGRVRLFEANNRFRFVDFRARDSSDFRLRVTDIPDPEQRTGLAFLLCGQGGFELRSGGAQTFRIGEGSMGVFHPLEPIASFGVFGERQQVFHIGFSLDLLQPLAEYGDLAPGVFRLTDGRPVNPVACGAPADPRMLLQACDILNCPYEGPAALLYLEARALDMLALLTRSLDERKTVPRRRWTLATVDRLHEARALILDNLRTPPSLVEIAFATGMSPSTLKRGLREVFGTSVSVKYCARPVCKQRGASSSRGNCRSRPWPMKRAFAIPPVCTAPSPPDSASRRASCAAVCPW